jgi:hypothetical protein
MATPMNVPLGTQRVQWVCKCGAELLADVEVSSNSVGIMPQVRCPQCPELRLVPGVVVFYARKDGDNWNEILL